jgi:hypothetical protein
MKSTDNTEKRPHYMRKISRPKKTDNMRKMSRCTKYKISGKGQIYTLSNG